MLDLDTVYKKYTEVVYKYLYTLCRNENIAEELTQETFYQAMRSLQKYNGTGMGAENMINKAIEQFRKRNILKRDLL